MPDCICRAAIVENKYLSADAATSGGLCEPLLSDYSALPPFPKMTELSTNDAIAAILFGPVRSSHSRSAAAWITVKGAFQHHELIALRCRAYRWQSITKMDMFSRIPPNATYVNTAVTKTCKVLPLNSTTRYLQVVDSSTIDHENSPNLQSHTRLVMRYVGGRH